MILIILILAFLSHFGGYKLISLNAAKHDLPKNSTLLYQLKLKSSHVFVFKTESQYVTAFCNRFRIIWRKTASINGPMDSSDLIKTISIFNYDDKTAFIVENNDENIDLIKIKENNSIITKKISTGEVMQFILAADQSHPRGKIDAQAFSKDGTPLYKWETRNIASSKYEIIEDSRWFLMD